MYDQKYLANIALEWIINFSEFLKPSTTGRCKIVWLLDICRASLPDFIFFSDFSIYYTESYVKKRRG